jgi:hypothetical protein
MTDLAPEGHWCPQETSPLLKLIMRNLARTYVGKPGHGRRPLGEYIRRLGGGDGKTDGGDLFELAEAVVKSLPAEVWIAKGGCGGEPIVACFTADGHAAAMKQFKEFWGDAYDGPLWPGVERVPLVKV